MFCSVESGYGIDLLAFKLRDLTTVIVGPSGVGKSSLINALRNKNTSSSSDEDNWFEPVCSVSCFCWYFLPCSLECFLLVSHVYVCYFQILGSKLFETQRVGEVSTRSGRGKHTTRNVSLLPLSGGGFIADTPGFNQPSLLKVTKQSLAQTFPEVCVVPLQYLTHLSVD